MSSYLYFDCGCSFSVDEGVWYNEGLCTKHEKELCEDDL